METEDETMQASLDGVDFRRYTSLWTWGDATCYIRNPTMTKAAVRDPNEATRRGEKPKGSKLFGWKKRPMRKTSEDEECAPRKLPNLN
jgi:hypothetical protein